jgi:tRNA(adenine34) deaminase
VLFWHAVPEITNPDFTFMQFALNEARAAAARGEVPVGAVVAIYGEVVARAGNRTIGDCDPTAHAEILALREAARVIVNHRILESTLYVTIEPCAMCAGAIIQARIARLVYGADDPKAGAVKSCFTLLSDSRLNHRTEIMSGVGAEPSAALLREFFAARR